MAPTANGPLAVTPVIPLDSADCAIPPAGTATVSLDEGRPEQAAFGKRLKVTLLPGGIGLTVVATIASSRTNAPMVTLGPVGVSGSGAVTGAKSISVLIAEVGCACSSNAPISQAEPWGRDT